jgi:hypothetical protein
MVDPGSFAALEIPVLHGRGIEDRDRAGRPPVVVINEETARHLSSGFGITDPVGRTVITSVAGYGPIPESDTLVEIVGVIRSERTGGLQQRQGPMAYIPLAQAPQQDIKLVVRTRSEPLATMSGIRRPAPAIPIAFCGHAAGDFERVRTRLKFAARSESPRAAPSAGPALSRATHSSAHREASRRTIP